MKKVIILAIVLIYIASIAVVNFFGLKEVTFDGTVYVNEIMMETLTVHRTDGSQETIRVDDESKVIVLNNVVTFTFRFRPASDGSTYTADPDSIVKNENQVLLSPVVDPTNADHKGVNFVYDEEAYADTALFYEDIRSIVFLKPGKITLTLVSVDGRGASTTFSVWAQE